MHLLLKSHVDEIAQSFEYSNLNDDKKFEYFVNYCITSKHFLGRFDPKSVTTAEDDASIDGIAIIIDGELITTVDDAQSLFNKPKRNIPVDIILIQSKSGSKFKKEEIANFGLGLNDFFSFNPTLPNGIKNTESINIVNLVLKYSSKIQNLRPNCHIYYGTSGVYNSEPEIEASFEIIKRDLCKTDYFNNVTITPIGRSELLKFFAEITDKNEAELQLIDYFGMPEMPGIPQSYLAIVRAKDLVEALLLSDDKKLNESVFEENVRSYLGEENEVNQSIKNTLDNNERSVLFSVLNNGITVVTPDLALIPNTKKIHLTNYQIINGCQTSNTLYQSINSLDDKTNVIVKFIESPNTEIVSDIISATNSQSSISKEAFLGLKEKAKLIQRYFDAKNKSVGKENEIYFERRQQEYKFSGYQATRIFDVREVARCYAAMFLNIPHNSARYVATIFSQYPQQLFKDQDHESYYYVACLALYRYQALINGRRIDAHKYIKVRWHIIHLFKWVATGEIKIPKAGSNKAEKYAEQLISILNAKKKSYVKIFRQCQNYIDKIGFPSNDELKRSKFTNDLASLVLGDLKTKASNTQTVKSKK